MKLSFVTSEVGLDEVAVEDCIEVGCSVVEVGMRSGRSSGTQLRYQCQLGNDRSCK